MTTEPAPAQAKAAKIVKTANGAARKADRKITSLSREADHDINSLAHRAEAAAKRAESALHDGVEALRGHTQAYVETAARSLDDARAVVSDKVRERPLTGLLAAAGVGLLLGLLIGSGRRR